MANEAVLKPEATNETASATIVGKPVAAKIRGFESKTKMQMSILVFPPENGGVDISLEQLRNFLQQSKVVYGIKEDVLERMVRDHVYDEQVVVAEGDPVVDGIDGKITERYPREFKPDFKERQDGTIDFKEMNLVVNISQGDIICDITHPVEGKTGMNIYGGVIKPRRGLAPIPPRGECTELSAEGTTLIASADGSLVFRKDKFCVDRVYTVKENVDTSTGNISFNGDVVVKGTVQEGFSVVSKGNVRVCGVVEGASITAGGNITLEKGINGMGHGILHAEGSITSKYIESCTISAGGNITAESIINCTLEVDGNVTVSGTQGRIVGGKLTVFGSIHAVNVGSRSAVSTVIKLGMTPSILREKKKLEEELKQIHKENEEASKNLAYLERAQREGQLETGDRKTILNALRLKAPMIAMREARMKQQLEQLEEEMQKVQECTLCCKTLEPPAKIMIGNAVKMIYDTHTNCRIYRDSEGEIAIGML